MAPLNFEALRAELHATHSEEGAREIPRFAAEHVPDTDLMSAAMYPKVRMTSCVIFLFLTLFLCLVLGVWRV